MKKTIWVRVYWMLLLARADVLSYGLEHDKRRLWRIQRLEAQVLKRAYR